MANKTISPPDPAIALLAELRGECRDWQDALSGEREGLDELCNRVDEFLAAVSAA